MERRGARGAQALCVLLGLVFAASEAGAAIPASERAALVALYKSTNGDGWRNRNWWRDIDDANFSPPGTECRWYGVLCNDAATHVDRLFLSSNNLAGALPPEIGNLLYLHELELQSNQLTGPIPAEIGNLEWYLQFLHLSGNQLSGPLPPAFGRLAAAVVVDLQRNQLTGPLPREIGGLAQVSYLGLSDNQIGGPIPPEIGQLSRLTWLYLDHNQLTGSIPLEMASLPWLAGLHLSGNRLSGPIPAFVSRHNLSDLELDDNQLSGPIPRLEDLPYLDSINLEKNQLSGPIPAQLGSLPELTTLLLGDNQLTGPIPPEMGALSLWTLRLENNQLTGPIPPQLGGRMIRSLHLENNRLTGPIPPLGTVGELYELFLDHNQLAGPIPPEILGWSLRELHLDHNHLSGWIPPEVDKFSNLSWLDLSSNDLSGPIPAGIERAYRNLRELHLENNHLSGPIPVEVGSLTQVRSADFSNNQLSGPIPASIGNLVRLERIALAGNQLSGEIPSSLASLTSLVDMGSDLRWNALHTSDPTLQTFLETKQTGGDWVSTQTLPPSGFSPGAPGVATVPLSWTPILYQGDGGGYRLWYGTTAGGPYELVGITAGKAASSAVVDRLTPATTYYFVAESVTDPHAHNQSRVASGVGAEVSATTTSGGQTWYGLTVARDGSGTGTVSATGISCGGVCAAGYAPGTSVTLVATPDSPWGFLGWSGDCSGTSATCVLTIDAPKAVTASFSGPLPQSFYTVPPCRLYDSRSASGGTSPLAAGTDTFVAAAGVCGLPSTARSVSLNVTVVSPTAEGHLELRAAGSARPPTSAINYSRDRTRANNAIVGLGHDGAVAVYVAQPTGTVHVVLDVNGYFE